MQGNGPKSYRFDSSPGHVYPNYIFKKKKKNFSWFFDRYLAELQLMETIYLLRLIKTVAPLHYDFRDWK